MLFCINCVHNVGGGVLFDDMRGEQCPLFHKGKDHGRAQLGLRSITRNSKHSTWALRIKDRMDWDSQATTELTYPLCWRLQSGLSVH